MHTKNQWRSLSEFIEAFPTNQHCIDLLESIRWPDGPVSPFEPSAQVVRYTHGWWCKATEKYFNVKKGTVFENTNLPLQRWFVMIYLMYGTKSGVSSHQMAEYVGMTQKTAWENMHKLRECLSHNIGKLTGIIEADESFFGGKNQNRHQDKKYKYSKGRRYLDKATILGMFDHNERNIRLFKIASPSHKETLPLVFQNIELGSTVVTDEWRSYHHLTKKGFNHKVIRHNEGKYKNDEFTTNNVENFWSVAKRAYHGTHIHISQKHIQKYCDEWAFRFNTRHLTNDQRFMMFLKMIDKPKN